MTTIYKPTPEHLGNAVLQVCSWAREERKLYPEQRIDSDMLHDWSMDALLNECANYMLGVRDDEDYLRTLEALDKDSYRAWDETRAEATDHIHEIVVVMLPKFNNL